MASWYWHTANESEPSGPVEDDILWEMARSGKLQRQDKVWRQGMAAWTNAAEIPNLFVSPPPIANLENASHSTGAGSKEIPIGSLSTDTYDSLGKDEPTRPSDVAGEVSKPSNASQTEPGTPKDIDVGGWLKFFCVSLTILGPLFSFSQMTVSWYEAQPAFEAWPLLKDVIFFENVVVASIVIYGFVIGSKIWSGNRNGKGLAERFLLIRLSTFITVELIILGLLSSLPQEIYVSLVGVVTGAIFRELIMFAIWFTYFKKSKRVSTTYASTSHITPG